MAELVPAEKELSDWFPERSEFSYTDRYSAHLLIEIRFAVGKFVKSHKKESYIELVIRTSR